MKKINLRGLSEVLSERELKNVMGGSGYPPDWATHYCTCSYQEGSWWGCYQNDEEANDAVEEEVIVSLNPVCDSFGIKLIC